MCSKLTTDSYAIYNAVQKYEIKQVLPDLVKFITTNFIFRYETVMKIISYESVCVKSPGYDIKLCTCLCPWSTSKYYVCSHTNWFAFNEKPFGYSGTFLSQYNLILTINHSINRKSSHPQSQF